MDNLIFTESNGAMFDDFKRSMMNEFDMSDLGLMHYFLDYDVAQNSARIFL